MPLLASQPLAVPSRFLAEQGPLVALQLGEPLWALGKMRDVFTLCAEISIIVDAQQTQNKHSLEAQKRELYEKLAKIVLRRTPHAPLIRALDDLGLSSWFPSIIADLTGTPRAASADSPLPLKDYLQHLGVLNQTIVMASQLREDMHLSNHKYIAHQIALLYQCLNGIRTGVETFKKRIESRFEEIKAVTEQSQCPQLSESQKQWLLDLCADVIVAANKLPSGMLKKVEPNIVPISELDKANKLFSAPLQALQEESQNVDRPPAPYAVLRGHVSDVTSVSFDPASSQNLVSGSSDGTLRLWNLAVRRTAATASLPAGSRVLSTAYVAPGSFVSQENDGTLRCWMLANGHNSFIAAPAQEKNKIVVYDMNRGTLVQSFTLQPSCGMAMALALACKPGTAEPLCFIGSEDGTSQFWLYLRACVEMASKSLQEGQRTSFPSSFLTIENLLL
eukprot:tig00020554_g10918.t1